MNEREALAELVRLEDLRIRAGTISPVDPGCEKEVLMDLWRQGIRPAWSAARAALAQPAVQGEPTDAMVAAYLDANRAYWQRIDSEPGQIGKWRNGTPEEATAYSLRAALAQPAVQGEPVPEQVAWRWSESNGDRWFNWTTDWDLHRRALATKGCLIEYAYAHPPSQPPRAPLTLTTDQIDALFKQVSTIGEHGVPYLIASALYFRVIAYSILDAAKEKQS